MTKAQKAPQKSKKSSAKKAPRKVFTRKGADKHELYQLSVQAPDHEIGFMHDAYKKRFKKVPLSLREDFCGTALLCGHWVKSNPARTATGVDISRDTLDWGISHNIEPLGDAKARVTLWCRDVRDPGKERFDIINALNFSYWVFRTRDEMRGYFATVRKSLNRQGMFLLDAYGGWDAGQPMREPRKIAAGFNYIWDQNSFDPISGSVVNHIHFEFKDGSKYERAFTYEWRFWTLPEITELLTEAGFRDVSVHWDVAPDDAEEEYKILSSAPNQPGWLCYITATP